jgi:hypothetical protein
MLPFFYYLLKVTICSGIMYCYYVLALRNKRFHQYNRFYLLSSVALSFMVPLTKIELWKETVQRSPVTTVITFVNEADAYVAKNSYKIWQWDNLFFIAIAIVSFVFLVTLFVSLRKIFVLIRKHPKKFWEGVCFVFTNSPGTPFSFFKYIFWNTEIDIESEAGRHILKHELAHVQENHTLDKIFLSVALIIGWCNPFSWLIKKELNMIHEFIADQKAISDGDAQSFAMMLLKATYPQQSFMLTNSFFHSPIKRRLLMLTSSKNARFTYLRRILVLPLLMAISLLFAFTFKQVKKRTSSSIYEQTERQQMLQGVEAVNFADATLKKHDGTLTGETYKQTMFDTANNLAIHISISKGTTMPVTPTQLKDTLKISRALVLLDGKIITQEELKEVQPSQIKSINVLKGEAAISKYGEKGKDGVIEVTTISSGQSIEQNQYVQEQQNFSKQQQAFSKEQQNLNKQQQTFSKEQQNYTKEQDKNLQEQAKYKTSVAKDESPQVDEAATFPGGADGWRRYLEKNLDANVLAKNGASAGLYNVKLSFDVSKDGTISNILAETKPGYGTEEEAIKAIARGPKWEPAKKDGLPVDSRVKQTISFMIAEK